jgi:5'-3' exonuclease
MTLLLVDGPNLMMRALHAKTGSMSTSDGVATGALVVFINTLSKHIREENPSHVVVVWEGEGGNAHRAALLPGYKAARLAFENPALQNTCFDLAELFLNCCDIPTRARLYAEADDTIAAYWAHATKHHVDKIVILSSDKDMLQLVGPNPCGVPTEQVRVSSHGAPTDRWDAERVQEHYGVPPAALPALLAIWGDAVDGVVGVPGLGKVKGAKLLADHNLSLADSFAEGTKYAEHRERVLINYEVVNLRDLDLYELPPRPFVPPREGHMSWPALMDFCDRYELTQIRERLLTGLLWRPGQDGPLGRRPKLRPAGTTG